MSKTRITLYALSMCVLIVVASASATMTVVAVDIRLATSSVAFVPTLERVPKPPRCHDCSVAHDTLQFVNGD